MIRVLRIIFGLLTVIPVWLILVSMASWGVPNKGNEWLFTLGGLPIVVIDMWLWVYPEMVENFISGKE